MVSEPASDAPTVTIRPPHRNASITTSRQPDETGQTKPATAGRGPPASLAGGDPVDRDGMHWTSRPGVQHLLAVRALGAGVNQRFVAVHPEDAGARKAHCAYPRQRARCTATIIGFPFREASSCPSQAGLPTNPPHGAGMQQPLAAGVVASRCPVGG